MMFCLPPLCAIFSSQRLRTRTPLTGGLFRLTTGGAAKPSTETTQAAVPELKFGGVIRKPSGENDL